MNKVLFVPTNPATDWGGSEKLWVYTAKRLRNEEAAKVGVLTKKWKSTHPAVSEVLNISEVFQYQDERPIVRRALAKASDRLHLTPHRERVFLAAIRQFQPDLAVISQGGNSEGLQWMELCSKQDVPYVTISQAAIETSWPDPSESERLGRMFLNAKRNFFASKDTLRMTELQVSRRLPNSSVVINPFDVPHDVQLEFPPVAPKFRLASVARFDLHAKGQDILLEALSDPKWKQRNIVVNLYGSGRDQLHIERLIKLFELQDIVNIKGFVPSIDIWKTDHALVMPSRFEGLPIALVEAMLCGRLAIVTNVSGNVEVIEDNVNGFVAEAPKVVYLDRALERAWSKRDQWDAMGQNAKNFIQGAMPPDPVADFAKVLMTLV